MSSKDTLRAWLAYRIKGSRAEPHHGLIYAWTEQEALEQAYAIFGCETEAERKRVYVQELQ
jgi:ribosomal protein L20A (L18A)